jgi:hypothetical protein
LRSYRPDVAARAGRSSWDRGDTDPELGELARLSFDQGAELEDLVSQEPIFAGERLEPCAERPDCLFNDGNDAVRQPIEIKPHTAVP